MEQYQKRAKITQQNAQDRVTVKTELRKYFNQLDDKMAHYALNTKENLHENEAILASLQRLEAQHNQRALLYESTSALMARPLANRDIISNLIEWLKTERPDLIELWDNQADLITGKKAYYLEENEKTESRN